MSLHMMSLAIASTLRLILVSPNATVASHRRQIEFGDPLRDCFGHFDWRAHAPLAFGHPLLVSR
jgi:hypothetical protein